MSHDIMIDLETLGTTADAAIVSIGAVRFDLQAKPGAPFASADACFYRVINIDGQPRRRISGATVSWWMGQSDAARSVFSAEETVYLRQALDDLRDWIRLTCCNAPNVWSNGADFDLPILNHAYEAMCMTAPWKPYTGRCYRTYKNLPGARAIKIERQGEHHNALDDAIYQAQHLCAIHAALFGGQGGAA